MSGTTIAAPIGKQLRYIRMNPFPQAIAEIEVYAGGRRVTPALFRANNLFADSHLIECQVMWSNTFVLDEVADNSYISVALNGEHGTEGAYAALKIDGKLVGAPSHAAPYPSNTWEYVNSQSSSNYTYYFPVTTDMKGKTVEVYVMGYDKEHLDIRPGVWISAYPVPYKEKKMIIYE